MRTLSFTAKAVAVSAASRAVFATSACIELCRGIDGIKEHNMVALWWNRTGKPLGDVRLKNELQVHSLAE